MALVKPAKTDKYEFAQGKYEQLPEIPFRSIIAAPSGAGKTVLLQSMVLGGKSPFSRIYIWSPSVNVHPAWKPVKQYTREELGVNEDKERFCFPNYKAEELVDVIETQKEIVNAQKRRGDKRLFSMLLIVDDFADSIQFSRHSTLLHVVHSRPACSNQLHHVRPALWSLVAYH